MIGRHQLSTVHYQPATNIGWTLFWSSTLLFAATTLIGLWAAYNPSLGIERFVFLASGLVIMSTLVYSARQNAATIIGVASVVFALMAGAIGLFFLIDADSVGDVGQGVTVITQFDTQIKSLLPVVQLPGKIHSSSVAGALVILIPLGLAAIPWLRQHDSGRWLLLPTLSSLIIGLFILILSNERSAWIAVACGSVVGGYLHWRFGRGQFTKIRWLGDCLLWVGTVMAGFAFFVVLVQPSYDLPIGGIAIGGSIISRGELWQEALVIIEDYIFTGSGLGSTAMVFSTYLFLLHVPFLHHAYNMFLQICIEQGAPGAIAFVFMLISTGVALFSAYRSAYPQRQTLAYGTYLHTVCTLTVVTLVAMVVHGMVDAGLYTSTLVPTIFFPLAFAMMLGLGAPKAKRRGFHNQKAYQFIAAGLPFAATCMLLLLPGLVSSIYVNMGTIYQTRVELGEYDWPKWPIQDAMRRNGSVNLDEVRRHYQSALTARPTNSTAHRRLGQIALSMGDYGLAQQHLEMAYATSPEQRVTRQLLGEVYAAQGNIDAAAELWESVPTAFRQHLSVRQWWYGFIEATRELQWLEESIVAVESGGAVISNR